MTAEQKAYLQALADVRAWHRWELAQCLGDVRAMDAHEKAIAWLDLMIATKKLHAVEDELDEAAANRGART